MRCGNHPVVAYAVHEAGLREVIGLDLGEVESGSFSVEFLGGLKKHVLERLQEAPTRSNASTKRSAAALTSSGSSPTTPP
jgi:hypothetical protein